MRKKLDKDQNSSGEISKKIEVLEENLVVEKKQIETGKVVITKKVMEEEVPLGLKGFKEKLEVDVKKIGQLMDEPGPGVRKEGDSTIYAVYREVYVKKVILEEEIWVTKLRSEQTFEDPEKLKREEVYIGKVTKKPPREPKK